MPNWKRLYRKTPRPARWFVGIGVIGLLSAALAMWQEASPWPGSYSTQAKYRGQNRQPATVPEGVPCGYGPIARLDRAEFGGLAGYFGGDG